MGVRRDLVACSAGAVYVMSAVGCCALAAHSQAHFVDMHVYRMGGAAVLHGSDLYRLRYFWLSFTYPPFAAIAFTAAAAVPWGISVAALTGASVVSLPVALYLVLRLPGPSLQPNRTTAWGLALAAASAAIWLEPSRTTLAYGQVDIVLAAAVLYDLGLPDTSGCKGIIIGLAAGLKLTPAIFIAYLLLTRRYRAVATGAAVFAGTVATGFAMLPANSTWYWAGQFANPGHIGFVQDPENQSLLGALARMLHATRVLAVWLPLAIAVAVAGLARAAAAARRGDEALGFSLCALTGLLVSPISWTHHWVIVIPALLVAGLAVARAYRADRVAPAVLGMAAISVIAYVGWARFAKYTPGPDWLAMPIWSLAHSVVYVIIGLAVLLGAWCRRGTTPASFGPTMTAPRR